MARGRRWFLASLLLTTALVVDISCQFDAGAVIGHDTAAATGSGDESQVRFVNHTSYTILVKPDDDVLGLESFRLYAHSSRRADPFQATMSFSYDHADQVTCSVSTGQVDFNH